MVGKISRYKSRVAAALIIGIGAVLSLLVATGVLMVNATPSVPVGLWIPSYNSALERGDHVVLDVTSFAGFEAYSWYPFKRTAWDRPARFLKQVAAMSGDVIELDDETQAIKINGELLLNSAVLSRDRVGNRLTAFAGLPRKLKAGELWLASRSARGFDSRYLGYAHTNQCRKVRPLLVY